MLVKYPILLLLILLALGGCDDENDNGGTIEPACVPNEELPNSECLAENLFVSGDLYFWISDKRSRG